MPAPTDARTALGDLVLRARTLAIRLEVAEAVQWTPCPRPRAQERPSGRASGARPSDPTAEVALDEARLALRAVVRDGENALADALACLTATARRLELALDAWYGGAAQAAAPERAPGALARVDRVSRV